MWKSVVYKEWIKLRWALLIATLLGLALIGHIFLKVTHDIVFYEAKNYWYSILFQGFWYFGLLKFAPLFIGLTIGLFQYFPEIVNKRIKLTFHLPLKENKVLLYMLGFGSLCLFIVYLLIFGLFYFMSTIYFPREIIESANISIVPWFLAGFAIYFSISLVVLEPVWKYRVSYGVVAVLFVSLYMESCVAGGYLPLIAYLFVLTVLFSISMLFSAYRFRKGEM